MIQIQSTHLNWPLKRHWPLRSSTLLQPHPRSRLACARQKLEESTCGPSPGVQMQLCQPLPLTCVIALILPLDVGLIEAAPTNWTWNGWMADSLGTLQSQINSLVAVSLQNRWALNLLTSEKGGTCIFLGEECCYFVNQSGIVRTKVKELKERIQRRQQENIKQWKGWDLRDWVSWFPALVGPLLYLILLVTISPCVLNTLVRFTENTVAPQIVARILTLPGDQP